MSIRCAVGACLILVVLAPTAHAQGSVTLIPPVDGAIVRHFDPPAGAYGPGHRGIDFAVAGGRHVRAAAGGTVKFAGPVPGGLSVSIEHGSGVVTTYTSLSEIWVSRGDEVTSGSWLGLAGDAHDGMPGLHFGVKVEGVYVDPAHLMAPLDLGGALRLTPLLWEPSSDVPAALATALRPHGPGSHDRGCVDVGPRDVIGRPPNDNVAIAVAGITSKTRGQDAADMYHPGPRFFGYEPERTYFFSYRGVRGPRLHEDYTRTDTYGDIRGAADRLGRLVSALGRRHPGAQVDLIAHSQGGIVARTYLTQRAARTGREAPLVEHLVTLASPHTGAPAASNVGWLRSNTAIGPPLLALARDRARAGWPLPDPTSRAVAQLTPESPLMESLASQDVTFGTRVLTLGIANDLVVPADRTAVPDDLHRIVPPNGAIRVLGERPLPGNGHSAIVTSPVARAYVHDFLRGRARPCPTGWDTWGTRMGRAVSWAESRLGAMVSGAEGWPGRALRTIWELVGGAG